MYIFYTFSNTSCAFLPYTFKKIIIVLEKVYCNFVLFVWIGKWETEPRMYWKREEDWKAEWKHHWFAHKESEVYTNCM